MKIKIIKVPKGSAPIEHRKALIGIKLKVDWELNHEPKGFAIRHKRVIEALREKKRFKAAEWWEKKYNRDRSYALEFELDCCKVLKKKKK